MAQVSNPGGSNPVKSSPGKSGPQKPAVKRKINWVAVGSLAAVALVLVTIFHRENQMPAPPPVVKVAVPKSPPSGSTTFGANSPANTANGKGGHAGSGDTSGSHNNGGSGNTNIQGGAIGVSKVRRDSHKKHYSAKTSGNSSTSTAGDYNTVAAHGGATSSGGGISATDNSAVANNGSAISNRGGNASVYNRVGSPETQTLNGQSTATTVYAPNAKAVSVTINNRYTNGSKNYSALPVANSPKTKLAIDLLINGFYPEASAVIKQIIDSKSVTLPHDLASTYNNLALSYIGQGEYLKAFQSWQQAKSLGVAEEHLLLVNIANAIAQASGPKFGFLTVVPASAVMPPADGFVDFLLINTSSATVSDAGLSVFASVPPSDTTTDRANTVSDSRQFKVGKLQPYEFRLLSLPFDQSELPLPPGTVIQIDAASGGAPAGNDKNALIPEILQGSLTLTRQRDGSMRWVTS